ncbi:20155_t:CDS:2, partial [Cetraspora pellucida]
YMKIKFVVKNDNDENTTTNSSCTANITEVFDKRTEESDIETGDDNAVDN